MKPKPFNLRALLKNKDALMPRLELALALERRPPIVSIAKADKPQKVKP